MGVRSSFFRESAVVSSFACVYALRLSEDPGRRFFVFPVSPSTFLSPSFAILRFLSAPFKFLPKVKREYSRFMLRLGLPLNIYRPLASLSGFPCGNWFLFPHRNPSLSLFCFLDFFSRCHLSFLGRFLPIWKPFREFFLFFVLLPGVRRFYYPALVRLVLERYRVSLSFSQLVEACRISFITGLQFC